jgi:hypothetical protein
MVVRPTVGESRLTFAEAEECITAYLEGASAPNDVLLMTREIFRLAGQVEARDEALEEIATSYGVECSYCHGVECRGNNEMRKIARAALDSRLPERKEA